MEYKYTECLIMQSYGEEMKKLIVLVLVMFMAGCATTHAVSPGMSGYTYERTTQEGTCRVTIATGREAYGAKLKIGKDCELTANADLTGSEQQRVFMEQMFIMMQPVLLDYLKSRR